MGVEAMLRLRCASFGRVEDRASEFSVEMWNGCAARMFAHVDVANGGLVTVVPLSNFHINVQCDVMWVGQSGPLLSPTTH
jgi:hypothetical protein